MLRKFNNKVLVLRPMESIDYIIEASDKKGGPGANFVVSYSGKSNLINPPFIESIMIGTIGNYGFCFSSPGVKINK